MAKILIVDDDATVVELLSEFLSSKGHEVISAGDPAKGMQLARQSAPDLVMLDYHMPGDTGAHLFEAFRRNRSLQDVPVLFMTGTKPEEDLRSEIASRAHTAYLRKPVSLDVLEKTVQGLLDKVL